MKVFSVLERFKLFLGACRPRSSPGAGNGTTQRPMGRPRGRPTESRTQVEPGLNGPRNRVTFEGVSRDESEQVSCDARGCGSRPRRLPGALAQSDSERPSAELNADAVAKTQYFAKANGFTITDGSNKLRVSGFTQFRYTLNFRAIPRPARC